MLLKKLAKKQVKIKIAEPEIDHYAGCKGYAQDVKRDLVEKGLFDENGDFIIHKFENGLRSGSIDVMMFK
jgi:hypothetical protein